MGFEKQRGDRLSAIELAGPDDHRESFPGPRDKVMRIDVPASGIQVADSSYEGLSEQAAIERLAQGGLNELPSKSSRNFLQTLFDVLREPMLLLLLGIAVVYAVLGDRTESITMGGAVLVVLGLTIVQERRTENAMSALRELSTPRAHVLRGGVARFVERSQVVIGDLVILSEGERVPADGVVVRAANLNIDESALTGESVPVTKRIGSPTEEMSRPGGGGESLCLRRNPCGRRPWTRGRKANRDPN